MTCSAGSAGTSASTDTHSNCTFPGTAISTTPEPKSSGSLPSGSRSEIHYPTVLHSSSGIYMTKKKRKLVRFFTVVAYMFAVSLVAIVLSLYYVFLWNPYLTSLPLGHNDTLPGSHLSPRADSYRHNFQPNNNKTNTVVHDKPSIITVSLMPVLSIQTETPLSSSLSSASLTSYSSPFSSHSEPSPPSSSSMSSSPSSPASLASPSASSFDPALDFASSSYSSASSFSPLLDFSSSIPSSSPPYVSSSQDIISSSIPSPPSSSPSSSDFVSAFSSFIPSSSDSSASSSTIDWIMDVTNSPNNSLN